MAMLDTDPTSCGVRLQVILPARRIRRKTPVLQLVCRGNHRYLRPVQLPMDVLASLAALCPSGEAARFASVCSSWCCEVLCRRVARHQVQAQEQRAIIASEASQRCAAWRMGMERVIQSDGQDVDSLSVANRMCMEMIDSIEHLRGDCRRISQTSTLMAVMQRAPHRQQLEPSTHVALEEGRRLLAAMRSALPSIAAIEAVADRWHDAVAWTDGQEFRQKVLEVVAKELQVLATAHASLASLLRSRGIGQWNPGSEGPLFRPTNLPLLQLTRGA